jgi:hypothetical protein
MAVSSPRAYVRLSRLLLPEESTRREKDVNTRTKVPQITLPTPPRDGRLIHQADFRNECSAVSSGRSHSIGPATEAGHDVTTYFANQFSSLDPVLMRPAKHEEKAHEIHYA